MALINPGGNYGSCLIAGLPLHIRFKNSLTSYCPGSDLIDLGEPGNFFKVILKDQSRIEIISLPCLLLDMLWLPRNPLLP